jgi:hypothetical protein
MAFERPPLTAFKYTSGTRTPLTVRRKFFLMLGLVLACVLSYVHFPAALVSFALPFLVFLGRDRVLTVGTRYLICGDEIVYFANVTQMTLNEPNGRLDLMLADNRRFVLEREKFPTGARKPSKIAANQAAKFNKVSARIIDRVRRARPELAGV